MRTVIAAVGILAGSASLILGADSLRFVQQIKLSSGQTAVVAEGDFEPRSIGSYSVRLYSGQNPGFPTDDFLAGIIRKRKNGYIEQVKPADVDGDGRDEIVVVVRCVGTGNYLSADAFAVDKKKLVMRASVEDLPPDADPLAALKKPKTKKI